MLSVSCHLDLSVLMATLNKNYSAFMQVVHLDSVINNHFKPSWIICYDYLVVERFARQSDPLFSGRFTNSVMRSACFICSLCCHFMAPPLHPNSSQICLKKSNTLRSKGFTKPLTLLWIKLIEVHLPVSDAFSSRRCRRWSICGLQQPSVYSNLNWSVDHLGNFASHETVF